MNYAVHYDRLIARARDRVFLGYRERHHILPRCMGGGDAPENIVELTAEEHYVAHQLLVKMHPTISGLVSCVILMAINCSGNRAYGWMKRRNSKFRKGKEFSQLTRERMSSSRRGKKHSAETRKKMSSSLVGNTRFLGKKLSKEHREKLLASHLGIHLSAEHRAKISATQSGRKRPARSEEWSKKISIALLSRRKAITYIGI